MIKVLESYIIGKYSVLKLERIEEKPWKKIKIGNDIYEPVPVYDASPDIVAIESNKVYTGKYIDLI